ncbi:hypothetical protein OG474_15670 [Kribbella sp. NBC_01505]
MQVFPGAEDFQVVPDCPADQDAWAGVAGAETVGSALGAGAGELVDL